MNFSFGATLIELRQSKKLTQKALAEKLSAYGFEVNNKNIYNWEKELSQPSIQQFLALCDILDVDDILWRFAGIQKGLYAVLNQAGRDKVREFIDLLYQAGKYCGKPEENSEKPRMLRLYNLPVSAGVGNFLEDGGFEMAELPAHVPDTAAFAVRVSGDSMEPLYKDGQIIWLRDAGVLSSGEIGVFVYDGNAYLKKLIASGGAARLRSLNPAYDDIEINGDLSFMVIGKVLS